MIALTPSNDSFIRVVDRVKPAQPIGAAVIERGEGPMLTILRERAGFVISRDRLECLLRGGDNQVIE